MRYVELANGEIISGDRASEMRRFARSIWVLLASKGAPPSTWRAADVESRKLYCAEMSIRFPELNLCELDWKAEQMATDNYPSWHSTWSKQQDTIKQEEATSQAPKFITQAGQAKHPHGESVTMSSKRAKVRGKRGGNGDSDVNTDKTAVNPGMYDSGMVSCNPGIKPAIAMKTNETAVANPAPSVHINGMPLMTLQDVGAHDMTRCMTSSGPGFNLSIANDMEVVKTVADPNMNGILPSNAHLDSMDPGMDGILPGNAHPELDVARTIGNAAVMSVLTPPNTIAVGDSMVDPGMDGIFSGNPHPELNVARTIGNAAVMSALTPPNITVGDSMVSQLAKASVRPEAVQPVQDIQDPSTPATTGTMTTTTSQDLPVAAGGVVSSMMDVSDGSFSTTAGVSIAVTSTQEHSILNANITAVKSPLATSTMLLKKIEGLMKSSPMVTAHASPPFNNSTVTASELGVGHSATSLSGTQTSLGASGGQVLTPVASASMPIKKSIKMRPGSSNTPRGLCSITWCAQNPRGTAAEFKAFYDGLPPAELKKYEDNARENRDKKQKASKVE